jgi:cytochrome o ubiquinol oxidase subunit 2
MSLSSSIRKIPRRLGVWCAALALSGCKLSVMQPHGDIAQQQADLIVTSTLLMLIIIVPVIALTLFFAWRYRASNTAATYTPDWAPSPGSAPTSSTPIARWIALMRSARCRRV